MGKQSFDSKDSEAKVITLDDIIGKTERKQENVITKIPEETKSILPLGMREIKLEDIDKKKVNYIENPLPVPKRREHKEMGYLIDELPPDKEDFDLKDMNGMDFFDIE